MKTFLVLFELKGKGRYDQLGKALSNRSTCPLFQNSFIVRTTEDISAFSQEMKSLIEAEDRFFAVWINERQTPCIQVQVKPETLQWMQENQV